MASLTGEKDCAEAVLAVYEKYERTFGEITRRSKERFERRDWHGVQKDAQERLDLYERFIDVAVADACRILGDKPQAELIWQQTKRRFSEIIAGRPDVELVETFYNSVTHRIVTFSGINPETEFVGRESELPSSATDGSIYRTYYPQGATTQTVEKILRDCQFQAEFENLPLDVELATKRIESQLWQEWHRPTWNRIEILKPIFYRNKGAYIVGRVWKHNQIVPLMLPLLHTKKGITVDAVLMRPNELSVVFSFARSYFHVDTDRPLALIQFLKSILPLKRTTELYMSIGHNKHGKRELYYELLQHLRNSADQFVIAPGTKGMVMVVFTLPSFPVVFKVIKDRFDHPKSTTREKVMQKYHLVFKHDRVGRLVDAQEFEGVKIRQENFSQELLDELQAVAAQSVYVDGADLVIKHLYTERRLTPLNLYVSEAPLEIAQEAVNDYGKAVKDLAAANIFPGDVFLKNFGVTRSGRVVFYDYDELTLLTECNFRKIPSARHDDDEFSSEPWFHVAEEDVFPEEFINFVGLYGPLRDTFFSRHGDLCSVEFWQQMQERQKAGEIVDFFPYQQRIRFRRDGAEPSK